MATGNIFFQNRITIDSQENVFPAAGLGTPATVACASNLKHEQRVSVGASAAVKVFDVDEDLASFAYGVIMGSGAFYLTLEDAAAEANNSSQKIPANTPHIIHPTILEYLATNEIDEGTPTEKTVGKIKVRSASGTISIELRLFA